MDWSVVYKTPDFTSTGKLSAFRLLNVSNQLILDHDSICLTVPPVFNRERTENRHLKYCLYSNSKVLGF